MSSGIFYIYLLILFGVIPDIDKLHSFVMCQADLQFLALNVMFHWFYGALFTGVSSQGDVYEGLQIF